MQQSSKEGTYISSKRLINIYVPQTKVINKRLFGTFSQTFLLLQREKADCL
jgi:hypothetical protein